MAEAEVDQARLFDAIRTPCLVLDPDLVIVELNAAQEQSIRRARHEVVGRHLFEAFPENPEQSLAAGIRNLTASLRRVLDTGQPDTMALQRYDIQLPGSSAYVERWWSPVNVPVLGPGGEVALLLHMVEDVTETVLAQRQLDERDQRFRQLVEHATDVIVIVDPDGTLDYVSPAVHRVLGYTADGLVGWRWGDQADAGDRDASLELLERARATEAGGTIRGQLRFRTAGGDVRWAQVHATNHLATSGIAGVVMNLRDVTEQRAAEALLESHALTDPLTGLSNRRAFLAAVRRALARSSRTGRPFAVLLIDLDNFKLVNDSLGHAAGDRLLVDLTARLTAVLRPADTLARLGGDEFVVLTEDLTAEHDAVSVADRVAAAATGSYQLGPALRTRVSLSIGVTTTADGADPEVLLAHADTALYEAKRRGRDRIEVFDPALREHLVRRLHLAHELHQALDQDELTLHWQPVTATATGAFVGAEALVRWEHPERGVLQPAEFLSVAEQAGLMPAVCSWVLDRAVGQAATWQALRPDPPRVFINLAAAQLTGHALLEELLALVARHDVGPPAIVLEVSELLLTGDIPAVSTQLHALRGSGFRVALDDFGAGSTALAWLQELPIDVLKLDRRFTAGLDDPATEAIVRAIVDLAPELGIATLAEGVETAAQLRTLAVLGCDYTQGFHLARPQPAADVTAQLAAHGGPWQLV